MLAALFVCALLLAPWTSHVGCAQAQPDLATLPIALDVGHSAASIGAMSARGVSEYKFNTVLAQRILETMQQRGLTGGFVLDSGEKRRSPRQRTRLAAKRGAALLLSVHHDSVQPQYLETWTFQGKTLRLCNRFQGYSLFYSERNPKPEQSLLLAQSIGGHLRLAGFTPSDHHAEPIPGENRDFVDPQRGVYRFDDLLVLHTAAMPAVLLEAGVIVNSIEERALNNPNRQQRMAAAIVAGLVQFLGLPGASVAAPFAGPRRLP